MTVACSWMRAGVQTSVGSGAIAVITMFCAQPAYAGDATVTYGSSMAAPVFEQVDPRGVDLIHGSLRVSTPIMELRQDQYRVQKGLQWTGQSWAIIGQPSIWRDGNKYIVMYRGRSEQFNDRDSGYSARRPVMGGKLGCATTDPGNYALECVYTDRDGDVVYFEGRVTQFARVVEAYGAAAYPLGNLGMSKATVLSANRASGMFGKQIFDGFVMEHFYNAKDVKLALGTQSLTIVTPNLNGQGIDKHYLRPKNTTQSITDSSGGEWRYTVDDDRRMTRIDPPGGAASTLIRYDGDKKVRSVTTAAGTWTYSYTNQGGDYGVTTVTDPYKAKKKVRYHHDGGFVTESWDSYNAVTDQFSELTTYTYDDKWKMRRIIYPDGNDVEFDYDSRGNVIERRSHPKPSMLQGTLVKVITTKATYPADCADRIICNQPTALTNEDGKVTDLYYATPGTRAIGVNLWVDSGNVLRYKRVDYSFGPNEPVRVVLPYVEENRSRPEINIEYIGGSISKRTICRTISPCLNQADAVVSDFDYANGYLVGKTETSDGKSLRTCYGYDTNGRRVTETPPTAGLTACPGNVAAAGPHMAVASGTVPTTPVWPDDSTPTPAPDPGSPPADPDQPVDQCGTRYGRVCQ